MFGLVARSYLYIQRDLHGQRVDIRELLHLAIERSNHLLIAGFGRRTPKEG